MKEGACQKSSHADFSKRIGRERCPCTFPKKTILMKYSSTFLTVMTPPSFDSLPTLQVHDISLRFFQISFQGPLWKSEFSYNAICCKLVVFARELSHFVVEFESGHVPRATTPHRVLNSTRWACKMRRSSLHPELVIL